MRPSSQFKKSTFVLDPRVRKLVEDLENMMERITNPRTRAELKKLFRPQLNDKQIEEILNYQLHLIVPDNPALPNIQDLLSQITLNGDLTYKKHSPNDNVRLNLPRSIIFLCDPDGNLISGVFTLSKDQHGIKPPKNERIVSSGSYKSRKDFVLISKTADTAIRMARLQVQLGNVIHVGQTFEAEINDPNCRWNTAYHSIINEITIAQQFNSPLIDRPRIGKPYIVHKSDKAPSWVVNIHDELAFRLSTFQFELHKSMGIITSLNYDEELKIRQEKAAGIPPTLLRKLIGDFLKGCKLLHDANVIHRDLKLDNLLLARDSNDQPYLKIADFGMAVNLSDAKYYFDLLARITGTTTPLSNVIIEVSQVKVTIDLIRKIPCYAEILNATELGDHIYLDKIKAASATIIQPLINEYAALENHNPEVLKILRMEPPSLGTLNLRLKLIRDKLLPTANEKYFRVTVAEPLETYEYASPEILKRHIDFKTPFSPEIKEFVARYDKNIAKQQPIAISDLQSFKTIVAATKPEKSHDMYAIGICIFELLYGRRPVLDDYELIEQNPVIATLLQPHISDRDTIDEAIENWQQWQNSFPAPTALQDEDTTAPTVPFIAELPIADPLISPASIEDLKRKYPPENFSTPPKKPRIGG